jgi:K+-transporting ATPase ATPase C chain
VSTGSNLGPSQPQLLTQARERLAAWRASEQQPGPAPQDMLTASASGLDPHISLAAALAQVARVAQARGLDAAQLAAQVRAQAAHPWFSDGQAALARVNVLQLNLLLETP